QGWVNPLARKYGVSAIPFTVLVDRAGRVVEVGVRGEALGPAVARLLGKEPPPPVSKAVPAANGAAGRLFARALAIRAKGDLDEAIAASQEAIRINKDSPEAHTNLGNVLHDVGRLDEAITEYRAAIATRHNFSQAYKAHLNLGNALLGKGRQDEAIAEYREAIRLNKDDALPHLNLGSALRDKGQLDEAIDEYREAIRLKKDFAEAHDALGYALRTKGQLDEAIDEHREAI